MNPTRSMHVYNDLQRARDDAENIIQQRYRTLGGMILFGTVDIADELRDFNDNSLGTGYYICVTKHEPLEEQGKVKEWIWIERQLID